jgi:hypothetical protein
VNFGFLSRWGSPFLLVALAAALIAAAILYAISTRFGLGVSPDSVAYLSAGANLAAHGSLAALDGGPYTLYAPGLPALIAASIRLGLDGSTLVWLANGLSWLVIVVFTYRLLRRHVAHDGLVAAGTLLTGVSPILLHVTSMTWTEGVFIALLLVFTDIADRLGDGRAPFTRLLVLALLVWAAFSIRYVGVCLALPGAVVVVRARRSAQRPRRETVVAVLGWLALALSGPVAWILRNLAVGGSALGPRPPTGASPGRVVGEAGQTVASWVQLFPSNVSAVGEWPTIQIGPAVVAGLVVVAALGAAAVIPRGSRQSLAVVVAVVMSYLAAVSYGAATTALDPLAWRYMSPAYPLLLVVCLAGASNLLAASRAARPVRAAALVVVLALVGTQGSVSMDAAHGARDTDLSWATGMRATLDNWDGPVVTNDTVFIWLISGHQPTLWWPGRPGQGWRMPPAQPSRHRMGNSAHTGVVKTYGCRSMLWVWLPWATDGLLTPTEVRRIIPGGTREVAVSPGRVFRTIQPAARCG